ncbi:putative glycosyltransferase [Actinoplanes missouriensis 431]|uniref:Putative glycosyltransferase n=1 Tax=Actinoplanes missouriensis (strain ATCC 14538 / DSM 43046 / CBS 188.64 / JCM 3121 / NBRC 102363 / NCIMB 12654 / NRRL B-3342 / UNCC 431) TaxID=512565 RepID=I0H5U1_ACTM4|nr:glycosyltransferase [Actinoplanes missouriensis]BAL88378.1 putative glycosyltransferase [Actinoplanes missouriensis 431]
MRILFTSVPAFGHLLPMLPLARAAVRAGHEVALLTHPSLRDAAPDLTLLPAGPSMPETLADVTGRTSLDALQDMARGAVEFFVESRLNLGATEALAAAATFAPDLVVADMVDFVGQLVAAARGVPFAVHGSTLPLAEPLHRAFEQEINTRFTGYGVTRTPPVAFVDPWPDSLLRPTDSFPVRRIAIRPEPHTAGGPAWTPPRFPGPGARPTVLVTLGTVVEDADALAAVVAALRRLDVNILVAPFHGDEASTGDRVCTAGFVPMKQLLTTADVVVSAAGAGTVLSVLSAGLPMVLFPMGLDKPVNAERAAAAGAALVVTEPADIATAVEKVLADPSYRTASAAVAAEIAGRAAPGDVLEQLLALR